MELFEAMGTARAMRWFTSAPVADELVDQVLWAATRASSPNNTQAWDFIVVRDAAQRRRLGDAVRPLGAMITQMPTPASATDQRTLRGARNLAEHFADVPVIIVICAANVYPPHQPSESFMYSSVFAAAQNLVVAARALGLGAAFTTLHSVGEPAFREVLGIPPDRFVGATIPLGWPARRFGPVTRRPMHEVVHQDRW